MLYKSVGYRTPDRKLASSPAARSLQPELPQIPLHRDPGACQSECTARQQNHQTSARAQSPDVVSVAVGVHQRFQGPGQVDHAQAEQQQRQQGEVDRPLFSVDLDATSQDGMDDGEEEPQDRFIQRPVPMDDDTPHQ